MDRDEATAAYAAAAERARLLGLRVMAETYAEDGQRYWFVPSARSTNGDWHRVWIDGGRFNCSCDGGQHGQVCTHKAVVRERYAAEQHEERVVKKAEADQQQPRRRSRLVVLYEAKPGRVTACTKCHTAFAPGEQITLSNGAAYCAACAPAPQQEN